MTRSAPTKHTPPRVVYRYLSGRSLDGVARTNGGYLRRGTPTGHGPVTGWGRLPGWQRQAWRVGVPAALAAACAMYRAAPAATRAALTVAAVAAVVGGWRAGRRAWRLRRFRAMYIRPTLGALRPALGDAPLRLRVDPSLGTLIPRLAKPMSPAEAAVRAWYGQHVEQVVRWLPDHIMRGAWTLQRAGRPVTGRLLRLFRRPVDDPGPRIELQAAVPYLTPEQRQYVSAVIGAKIPAGELVERWDQVGTRVSATWTVRRRPPARVGYADLAARIDRLAEWEFFLGLGVGDKPVIVSLRDDSPHICVSASSGAGKSVLAQAVALQVLARGGQVVILDIKGSHRWALGLPGVTYCTSVGQIHDALVRIAAIASERNALALHEPEDWDPGPRILAIGEELNATMDLLVDHWADIRDKSEPKKSPAIRGAKQILSMGRSAKVNMIGVAQMLTARSIGGPEARENFAIRCLARYSTNAWKMLVPEAAMPRASRTQGRWQIVVGGVATECQVAYLSAPEARLFVTKMSPVPGTPLMGAGQEMSPGHGPVGDTTDPLSETVTLREAVTRGIAPWSFDAAKKRLQRARKNNSPTVPTPAGRDGLADVYRVGDLIVWVEAELGLTIPTSKEN